MCQIDLPVQADSLSTNLIGERTYSEEFFRILLNGMSLMEFLAYYTFGLIGLVGGWLLDIYGRWKAIQKSGGFSFKYWWKKNSIRVILSLFMLFIGILCTQNLLGSTPSLYNSIVTGLGADKIIHAFKKRAQKIGEDD